MKQPKIIFPLTFISMFLITKWWFVLPVDGPDKLFWGFPFAFMGEGFHTSMSYQFFAIEFIGNLVIYFLAWSLLFLVLSKRYSNLKIPKILSGISWSLASILVACFSFYISISNPIFHIKKSYDWKVMKTGYVFIWQATPRPDILELKKKEDAELQYK